MSVKTPIFKILRCRCNWQRRDAEPVSPVPLCPKCGAQPAYSTDWYMKVIVDGKPRIQAISRHKRHAETALTKAEAEIFYDRFQVSRDQPLLSEAIDTVQPFGLDLCSGVRTEGKLDLKKLEAFFAAFIRN